jgi:hypothetical protein
MAFETGARPAEAGGTLGVAGGGRLTAAETGVSAASAIVQCEHARSWSVEVRTGRIVAAPCRQCEEPWETPDDPGA